MKKIISLFKNLSGHREDDGADVQTQNASHSPQRPAHTAKSQAKSAGSVTRVPGASGDFASLGLAEPILRAIAEEGYAAPTPIQQASIPYVISGRDLLGCAQTGTGKTAAFAMPLLHRLAADGRGLRALILTPTRELAIQIADSFKTYGRHLNLKTVVVFGGVGIEPQKRALAANPDILVATPGRLLDLMGQRAVSLTSITAFVLDEADRMLDMGFIHDVRKIIAAVPKRRQTLLFSATMPRDIVDLAMSTLNDPAKVEVAPVASTSEQVTQSVYFVNREEKRNLLLHVMQDPAYSRVLVFTRTKAIANRVSEFLTKNGIKAEAIHGNKSQSARQRALEGFRKGAVRALVASDLAARGLDIDEVSHVINYDVPNIPETYVHRIGRTGRADHRGLALSFCEAEERPFLYDIEALIKRKVPVVTDHPFVPTGWPEKSPRLAQPTRSGGRPSGGRSGGGGRPSGGRPNGGGGGRPQSSGGRPSGGGGGSRPQNSSSSEGGGGAGKRRRRRRGRGGPKPA